MVDYIEDYWLNLKTLFEIRFLYAEESFSPDTIYLSFHSKILSHFFQLFILFI
jgi:hypothetical protein